MKQKNIVLIFLLPCLLFTGCKKDDERKDIIGQWELIDFSYWGTHVSLDDGTWEYQCPKIDYQPTNIIYDFQGNGKLIVSCFVKGKLQRSEHSYKYIRTEVCPACEYPNISKNGNNLQIDEDSYLCVFNPEYKSQKAKIWIGGFVKTKKTIDDIDLALIEHENITLWDKTFFKLK